MNESKEKTDDEEKDEKQQGSSFGSLRREIEHRIKMSGYKADETLYEESLLPL
ncbi:MAG: hypothetical protein HKUEN02_01860 [Anaerolineaceae bacterium]|nr:MAG: hypothetical protein HKUEN02_01860 [Anaerolineaceae bacterium]